MILMPKGVVFLFFSFQPPTDPAPSPSVFFLSNVSARQFMLCMLLRRGQDDQQLLQQLLTALYQSPVSVIQRKMPIVLKLAKSSSNRKFCQEVQGLITAICRAHGLSWGCAASLGHLTEITCGTGDCDSAGAASELSEIPFLVLLQSVGHDEAGQQTVFASHAHSLREGLNISSVRQECQYQSLLQQHAKVVCMTFTHTTAVTLLQVMHCKMTCAELLFVFQKSITMLTSLMKITEQAVYID